MMMRGLLRIGFWIERNPWFLYLTTIAIWSSALLSKLLYNGLVYGFDYGLFHPDGALYTFRTLLWSGYSEFEAGKIVSEWYDSKSFKAKYEGPELYYSTNSMWDQYSSRVLYPLLSIPFVKLLGPSGMLVIPSMTFLFVLLAISRIAIKSEQKLLGFMAIFLITMSTTTSRWMFANTSDGLLLAFTTLIILICHANPDLNLKKSGMLLLLFAVVGSSLTRFSLLTWVAIGFVFLLRGRWKEFTVITFTALLGALPVFLNPFFDSVLPGYGEKSFLEKTWIYPVNLVKVTFVELGQLFVLDRVLLVLLVVTILLALTNLKTISSQMFLATLVAVWLTGAINGVLGVNFRYQLPVIPIMLWALVDLLPNVKRVVKEYSREKTAGL